MKHFRIISAYQADLNIVKGCLVDFCGAGDTPPDGCTSDLFSGGCMLVDTGGCMSMDTGGCMSMDIGGCMLADTPDNCMFIEGCDSDTPDTCATVDIGCALTEGVECGMGDIVCSSTECSVDGYC